MLRSALSSDEFRLTSRKDGDGGIAAARREAPDLVMVDVDIPGRSGLDVMMELRADPQTADTPIMALSAVGDEEVVVQALRWADDCVLKPFRPLELKTRVRKILDRRRADGCVLPEASGKYAYATTRNKRFLTGYGISELADTLRPTGRFLRIHRSYVVNIDCIFKVTRDESRNVFIVMSDDKGAELRVSDSYLRDVKQTLGI
jgi:DNA-binding response OmpR family regulator